jgi:EmrB/QacA subfamily drug resistance transporter
MNPQRRALIAAILGSGMVFLDGTIVNVALPSIRSSLHGGLATQQWVVEAYLLTLGSLILVGGSLGDILGRRRVFAAGIAGFGCFSLLCALAPTATALIVFRALQGVAGALLVPSTLALIVDTFPEPERAAAIGSWTAWGGIATVIGPLGGGLLIQALSWRLIFAVNLPAALLTLYLLSGLPADRRAPVRLDLPGAALCTLGLAGPVFALIGQPAHGWTAPATLIPLLAGLAVFAAFLVRERRAHDPMLPLVLFRTRNFAVGNVTTLALYAGLNIATFLVVLFEQQVAGYTPLEAGLSLLPLTLLLFTLSRRTGALAARLGPHRFMAAGPALAGAGLLLFDRVSAHADYLLQVFPAVIVFGLGMALTVAPLTATVLAAVPAGHSGIASGVNNAVARVAGLLAIAVIGVVISAAFQSRLRSLHVHAQARAFVIAAGHPAALRDASLHAFHTGVTVAAGLAFLGALASFVGIQDPRGA